MPASLKVIDVGTRKGILSVQSTSKAIYDGDSLVDGGQFTQVYNGPAQNQWAMSLNTGHYAWVFTTETRDGMPRRRKYGAFFHGVTAEDFSKLHFLKARVVRVMATSDGVKWRCDFPGGCDHESTTELGAYEHELEHMGRTLGDALKRPEMVEEAQYQAVTASKKDKRSKKSQERAGIAAQMMNRITDEA